MKSMAFDAKSFVAGLPNLPGVYRMLDHLGLAPIVPQAGALLSERFAEAHIA